MFITNNAIGQNKCIFAIESSMRTQEKCECYTDDINNFRGHAFKKYNASNLIQYLLKTTEGLIPFAIIYDDRKMIKSFKESSDEVFLKLFTNSNSMFTPKDGKIAENLQHCQLDDKKGLFLVNDKYKFFVLTWNPSIKIEKPVAIKNTPHDAEITRKIIISEVVAKENKTENLISQNIIETPPDTTKENLMDMPAPPISPAPICFLYATFFKDDPGASYYNQGNRHSIIKKISTKDFSIVDTFETTPYLLQDLAFDPATEKLYATGYTSLFEFELKTQKAKHIFGTAESTELYDGGTIYQNRFYLVKDNAIVSFGLRKEGGLETDLNYTGIKIDNLILDFIIVDDLVYLYHYNFLTYGRPSGIYIAGLNQPEVRPKLLTEIGYYPGLANGGVDSFYALNEDGYIFELSLRTGEVVRSSSLTTANEGYKGFGLTSIECK